MKEEEKEIKDTGIDEETQEILNEMKEEEESVDPIKPVDPPEPKEEEKVEKTEDSKKDSDDKDDGDDKKDTESKEDDKSKEDKKPDVEKTEREVRAMPIAKYQKKKEKWQADIAERDAKILALTEAKENIAPDSKLSEDVDEAISQLSEKHNVDSDLVKDLLAVVDKTTKRPEDPNVKVLLAREAKAKQDTMFDNEIESLLADESISEKDVAGIKKAKSEIKELAFTEDYKNSSAFEIYFRSIKPKKTGRKSAESGKGRPPTGDVVDYDKVTDNDLDNMSEEEQDKYFEYMEKNHSKPRFSVSN